MDSSVFSWAYALLFAVPYLDIVHGYVLSPRCHPYSDDILTALQDAITSHEIAYYSLVKPDAQRADWFGLLNSVFPGVMDIWADEEEYNMASASQASAAPLPTASASRQAPDLSNSDSDSDSDSNPSSDIDFDTGSVPGSQDEGPYWDPTIAELYNVYRLAMEFSVEEFGTIRDARQMELHVEDEDDGLEENITPVTYNLLFSCDPSTFTKTGDNKWWDSDTQQLYAITADVICDYDTKARLALRPQPFGFVVILCPAVLTQRAGEPKMWADLTGRELSNTRHSVRPADSSSVTEIESLDLLSWTGMRIDQLRERVLSVYMGRVILFLTGQKYYQEVFVRSMEDYRSFDQCKTLPLGNAVHNLDSLSIYSTGARFYYNEVVTHVHFSLSDPDDFGWITQNTHRWDTRGILYNNRIEADEEFEFDEQLLN